MQPTAPIGLPQTQYPGVQQAPTPQTFFGGKTPSVNFGCATDSVRFGADEQPQAAAEEKKSEEPKENALKKYGGKAWELTKRYALPVTTIGAGTALALGSQTLHLLVPVLGSVPAIGLGIAGGAIALGGAWWAYKNYKKA